MKQIQLLLLAGSCLLFSCGKKNEGGMSDTAKKNLEAFNGVSKCIDSQDFTKISDFIAADAVDHSDKGELKGLEAITANMKTYGDMSTGMSSDVVKALADDEYVMSWMKFRGTAKSAAMGMKPGEKYEMQGIEVARCKDGKIVEHWSFVDPAEMMKMMGNMNQAAPDTAKMSTMPAASEK